ncbi:MAG: hydroxymethylpyrimidine transporter CytX, partial [Gammaproteobacteria bacterium]|nr:hydroxymethylpyrimidine transporter CytX [Gammaproteobacteria bacterium]
MSREIEAESGDQTAWPLTLPERTWTSWQLYIALTTAGAATWCYIIGEYVGYYLNFRQGVAALVAGSMLGTLVVSVAAIPTCIRFGIDSISGCTPQFGTRGWALPATLQYLAILGWNCVLVIFFGKSAAQFLVAVHAIRPDQAAYVVPSATLFACGLIFLTLVRGMAGVDRLAKILVAHVLVGFWMLYLIMSRRWHDLASAVPASPSPNPLWNIATGVEIGVSTTLSWWPYIGAMVRMAPSGRAAAV